MMQGRVRKFDLNVSTLTALNEHRACLVSDGDGGGCRSGEPSSGGFVERSLEKCDGARRRTGGNCIKIGLPGNWSSIHMAKKMLENPPEISYTVETAYKVTGYKVKSLIKYINYSPNTPLQSNFRSEVGRN